MKNLRLIAAGILYLVMSNVVVVAAAQNTTTQPNAKEHSTFWGKAVVSKTSESKRDFGGGFQFRSVAYYMDCASGCFENPWHIGELWFKSRMLANGLAPYDVSVSPSKRFVLFQDRLAGKIKVFDGTEENVKDAVPANSEELEFTWREQAHEATVRLGKVKYKVVLPE